MSPITFWKKFSYLHASPCFGLHFLLFLHFSFLLIVYFHSNQNRLCSSFNFLILSYLFICTSLTLSKQCSSLTSTLLNHGHSTHLLRYHIKYFSIYPTGYYSPFSELPYHWVCTSQTVYHTQAFISHICVHVLFSHSSVGSLRSGMVSTHNSTPSIVSYIH